YGNPTGRSIASIAETVTTNFVGGSNSVLRVSAPTVGKNSGDVTLRWSSVEGGTYVGAAASEFKSWTTNILPAITATGISTTATNAAAATSNPVRFYGVSRTA